MKLHELKRSKWFKDKSIQVWRGDGSWRGNYSGKWCKWQQARSWFSLLPSFEWGQTPTVQRFPKKRWFTRFSKLVDEYSVLNLKNLERDERITTNMEINKEVLIENWYIKKNTMVKILGDWDFSKVLNFVGIEKFSKTAQEKIEKVGWKIA